MLRQHHATIHRLFPLIVALALAACGGAASPSPSTSTETTAAPTITPGEPQPTATDEPRSTPTEPAESTEPTEPAEPTATAPQSSGAVAGEVTVGILTDRSGATSLFGPMVENGFNLGLQYAAEELGLESCEVNVVVKDTGADPEMTTKLAREMIEADGVDVLLSPPASGAALAAQNVAAENKRILIAVGASTPDLTGKNFNPYTFRVSRTSEMDALAMATPLQERYEGPFIQLLPDAAFGHATAGALRGILTASGGEFAGEDIFVPMETTDFTPYLQQVLNSGARVLIVVWPGAGALPLFQQIQEQGIFDDMEVVTPMVDNQTIARGYGDMVGALGATIYHYTLPESEINDWLVSHHQAEFESPPDVITIDGFAAALMLMEGLNRTGCQADAEELIPAFEGLEFESPKGKYIIRPGDHVALQPMYLVRLTNVDDPDAKFFELVEVFDAGELAPPCNAGAERCELNN